MANRWGIPSSLEREIRRRDKRCVYCGLKFPHACRSRGSRPSWEHIDNDPRHLTKRNLVLCCGACNSSKGAKDLFGWLQSAYCKKMKIGRSTVAPPIRAYLKAVAKRG